MRLTRRTLLGGLAAAGATRAWAEAPAGSIRPLPRPTGMFPTTVPGGAALVERSRLTGSVGFAVADAETGQMLETHNPLLPQPPASTAKALTTLYALDRLGHDHRFETRLLATGPISDGRLEGDLILAGGGDPTLDTDSLAEMAIKVKERGIREIVGGLKVWTGALPNLHEIDVEQPDHVAYNPSLGGLNLNYNRVHFEWKRQGEAYRITMEGRSARMRPGVTMARMRVVDRVTPVYDFSGKPNRDDWTVARRALGADGARWLPVRRPGLYAGEILEVLLRSNGIVARNAMALTDRAEGEPVMVHHSAPLGAILRDMLWYSNNLTAEIVGLASSGVEGGDAPLAASGRRMSDWLERGMGLHSAHFEDHSGLGDDSRISASDMTRAILESEVGGALRPLLKDYPLQDTPNAQVFAKTGTLNYVSALTGFLEGAGRPPLAFAIFCADIEKRDALPMEMRERPPGGATWLARARTLQRALLARWSTVYTA